MNPKKYFKWLIAFVAAVAFLVILDFVTDNKINEFDSAVLNYVASFRSPALTPFMRIITECGGAYVIGAATIILFFAIKNKRLSFAILGNIIGILVVNQLFKFAIQRPRPDEALRLIEQGGYSFPSGHSMGSMAFYGFLVYLDFRYFKNNIVRWGSTIALGLLVALIGISRIYLGVHYPSDVLAGFLLTIAYLIFYISLVNYINFETRRRAAEKQSQTRKASRSAKAKNMLK